MWLNSIPFFLGTSNPLTETPQVFIQTLRMRWSFCILVLTYFYCSPQCQCRCTHANWCPFIPTWSWKCYLLMDAELKSSCSSNQSMYNIGGSSRLFFHCWSHWERLKRSVTVVLVAQMLRHIYSDCIILIWGSLLSYLCSWPFLFLQEFIFNGTIEANVKSDLSWVS